jgi:hypothetical protein
MKSDQFEALTPAEITELRAMLKPQPKPVEKPRCHSQPRSAQVPPKG